MSNRKNITINQLKYRYSRIELRLICNFLANLEYITHDSYVIINKTK